MDSRKVAQRGGFFVCLITNLMHSTNYLKQSKLTVK